MTPKKPILLCSLSKYLFLSSLVIAGAGQLRSEVWHVRGGAAGDGRTSEQPFGAIQQAADVVKPGDTVIIQPGIYFEHVQLRTKGTAERPIIFKTDGIGKGRVVLTGAIPAVREKKVHWTLEDKDLCLYSIPWDQPRPTRVLYGGTDLYPYLTVDQLKEFMAVFKPERKNIGPQHGFAIDPEKKRLYVRLYAADKYGSSDPNNQVMSISPPPGNDELGLQVSSKDHYNFGILGEGSAHVLVQGITFETPGISGLYTEANDVTVSDCWFVGCRGGVQGTAPYFRPESFSYDHLANRVTVENCLFTQFPTYADGCETLRLSKENPPKVESAKPRRPELPFWARKDINGGLPGPNVNYEVGIVILAGRDWVIRRSHVDDAFEALSSRATTNSDNLQIYENIFENLLDNAVETEDHSTNLHFYRNVIRNCFSPLSWQPLEGKPWPGPAYFYQNIIYNDPAHDELFGFRMSAPFKIGATDAQKRYGKGYVPEIPNPGIIFFNNTIVMNGISFWPAIWGNNPDKVKVYNNVLILNMEFKPHIKEAPAFLDSANNFRAPFPGTTVVFDGDLQGKVFATPAGIGLQDPLKGLVVPDAGSPVLDASVPVPGVDIKFRDVGAIQRGDAWYPFVAGPRTTR